MYSFFLLLSIWMFISGLLDQRLGKGFNKTHLLPLSFILASIVQFNICYLLILNVGVPQVIGNLLLCMASVLIAISLITPSWRHSFQSLFTSFVLPSYLLASQKNPGLEKQIRNIRLFIVIFSIFLMLITQILTSSVMNWDSNWYNLSRLPAMIITHSVFPETSPILWHIIHPITHDILYLIDIALLSLRGMGLVSLLEFIVILGCLYQIVFFLLPRPLSGNGTVKEQLAILLVTILFFSSDLQVLQTTVPKNDLVILMTFVISLTLSLDHELRRRYPAQYLLSILIVTAYSISSKSYGIIVLIPPLVAGSIDFAIHIHSASLANMINLIKTNLGNLCIDFLILWNRNKYIVLITTLIVSFSLYTYAMHDMSIRNSINNAQIASLISEHTNLKGPYSDRIINFFLNSVRNATSFLMYPYTTLTKINSTKPDDYFFGFGPLNHIISNPRGNMNASTIVRVVKADAAYGSIFLVPTMIIVIGSLYSRRLKIPSRLYKKFIIIILSSLFSFLLLSFVLLGQSFGSKFMGSSYIPLIPLLSVAATYVVNFKISRLIYFVCFLSILTLLRVSFLLDITMIPAFLTQLTTSPNSLVISQSPNLFYYQYAGSRYSPLQANRWLLKLASLPSGKTHFFCYGDETPTLTPLMYAIQSFNRDSHLELRLSSKNECELLKQDKTTFNRSLNLIDLF